MIGQYLGQLETVAKHLDLPLITGKTPNSQRELLYSEFRKGTRRVLVEQGYRYRIVDWDG